MVKNGCFGRIILDIQMQRILLPVQKYGVINLCKMKYSLHPITLTAKDDQELQHKRMTFLAETDTRKAVHITMVTAYGLTKKAIRLLFNPK